VKVGEGVIPELRLLVGQPGLKETERKLAKLLETREKVLAEMNFDPDARAMYRLKENVGKHVHNGRKLKPGDVIELSAAQAKGMSDKFEPVTPVV
jgi:hypothetical protein